MAIKSDAEIYRVIERHMKESAEPLTCNTLWDFADVKQNASSAERVSDFLGHMFRRGLLQRWTVPRTSTDRSRFAYSWIAEDEAEASTFKKITPIKSVNGQYNTDKITITEDDGRIIIDFPKFTLIVQSKG